MASLVEALFEVPTDRLRRMIQNRQIDPKKLTGITTKRQLVQTLSNELSRQNSAATGIVQCNAQQLSLLQLLVSLESNPVPWCKLLEAAGDTSLRPVLEPIVESLEELGLAFRIGSGIQIAPNVNYQVPISLSDRYTLEKALNQADAPAVKRILTNLNLKAERDVKASHVTAISHYLLDPANKPQLAQILTENETEVLEYLIAVGGSAPVYEVANALLGDGSADFYRYDWQNRWKSGRARNSIDRLLGKGLIHTISHGYGYSMYLIIPGDLLQHLTGTSSSNRWASPPPIPHPLETEPQSVLRHTYLLRDMTLLLAQLNVQDAARTSTGHIHKTNLKNIMRLFSLQSESYANFVYAMCREAGLIEVYGPKQIYQISAKGNAWLHWDSLAQIRTLFDAWRQGSIWAEMYQDPLMKAGSYRPQDAIRNMRYAVLHLLIQYPAYTFFDLDSVAEALAFRKPLMLAQNAMMSPDLLPAPLDFVANLVALCLYWFGMVELGASPAENITPPSPSGTSRRAKKTPPKQPAEMDIIGYRLTALGAWLFQLPDAKEPEAEPREGKFVVQPNAEIFVPPYLAPTLLYRLMGFTDVPGKAAFGNTLTLTRESIRRALDQGETVREILAFLQANSRTGIPQNVEYLINEVSSKHGHIRIGRAQMYLQTDTPILLKELQARRELKPFFVRALSDTIAIMQADDPDKLLRELRKAGYLPVSEDDTRPAHSRPTRQKLPDIEPISPLSIKEAKQTAKTEAALDWARIAQEDNTSYRIPTTLSAEGAAGKTASKTSPPVGATTSLDLIRYLLEQAVIRKQCIELSYQGQGEPRATFYLLEPSAVYGNFVNGFNQETQSQVSLNIKRIQWVRATQTPFSNS
jgi:hypothetical protein